ncbi:hypothetical protein [Pseudonocardia humida]|uniref:Uncharacterized protein n=1 Tax=Pseudonocardia humida TaxID=2800819 RepID=A0ABT0ZYJ8_9PSEU|nr:hypothetical protein [Pseudonocardia humida]MCO1655817.1 hypothetical protein [Pseudonocardia humida]
MTTADRHTDTDPRPEGGAYRASDVDVTAQDDAARYEDVDGTAAAREPGGYAQRHGDAADGTDRTDGTHGNADGYGGTQRLDAQDADLRGDPDPTPTDATATDEPRTEGGYPHSAESVDRSGRNAEGHTEGHTAGRHADSDLRTADADASATSATGTSTGTATTGTAGSDKLERLVPSSRVDEYTTRWDAVKVEFVDEPRQAVAKADKLVGELLDELDQLFRKQRSDLEHGLDADETSTEDLRLALRRYRSFFDRLLQL